MLKYKQSNGDRTFFESVADFCFFLWNILGFLYERSNIGRTALFMFCSSVLMLMLFRTNVYKNQVKNATAFNLYFISYVSFIIYVYWHTYYSGMAIDSEVASKMLKTLCLNGLFYYTVYKYCLNKKDNLHDVLNIYVGSFVLIMIYLVIKVNTQLLSGRLGSSIDFNSNSIAMCLSNCIIILMYSQERVHKKWKLFIMGLMIFFVLISGSRKGIIGLAIGMLLYTFIGMGMKKIYRFIIAVGIVALLYFLIINIDVLYNIIGYRVEALLSFLDGGQATETSLYVREQYGELGWRYVEKNPLYGHGLDCFREIKGAYDTYSHNNYLELLFGVGIIGTMLYYFSYIYVLVGHTKLYIQCKQNISKLFTVLIVTQMVLEYAFVSYYSRSNIVLVVIALASYKDLNEKIKKRKQ